MRSTPAGALTLSPVLSITDPAAGPRLLLGRYEVLEEVGGGGMGCVFRCVHALTRSVVAVKRLRPELRGGEAHRRFLREARAAGALRHPNIVQVHDVGEEDDGPVLVLEWLDGEDLEQRLSARGRLSLGELLPIVAQAAGALQAAHRAGIVHRDVKPANLFLVRPPEGHSSEVVKVVDFGVARLSQMESHLTKEQTLLGTPSYMPPEMFTQGGREVDSRADQWALGVLCYRALSGQLPFAGQTLAALGFQILQATPPPLSTLVPQLSPHLVAVVARAMALRPEDRFPDVASFAAALRAAAESSQVRARSVFAGLRVALASCALLASGVLGFLAARPTGVSAALPALAAPREERRDAPAHPHVSAPLPSAPPVPVRAAKTAERPAPQRPRALESAPFRGGLRLFRVPRLGPEAARLRSELPP